MSWIENNLVQLMYTLDVFSRLLPFVLCVVLIFILFLVRSYARRLSRMEFYLDRIDNHLREITYVIKEYHSETAASEEVEEGEEDPSKRGSISQR